MAFRLCQETDSLSEAGPNPAYRSRFLLLALLSCVQRNTFETELAESLDDYPWILDPMRGFIPYQERIFS